MAPGAAGAARWCVPLSVSIEGKQRQAAVIVVEDPSDPTSPWKPESPKLDVACTSLE
ncbi:MAG TPA: hypothetical protein VK449_04830 [Anaerolineales bacterium]|nr:hypothetical protein [Anaerolineales bacterium]